ncbi:MAG TPA: glutathione S-transferase family protein [Solirubrobacteraceae bacterium]|nr:glutathione S-transferase family protein [Solirubrobacteraceae bacterium]
MLRIYHREYAGRPIRALWTLEEIGAPYELTLMDWEEGSGEQHRARHPLGRVPVLEDDEGFVFESTAICFHLADLHPQAGLLPPLGTHERALAYQWSCFAPAELEPPLIEAAIFRESDPDRSAKARARFVAAADAVAQALLGCEHLVGERFGVPDVLVATALSIPERAGFPEDVSPDLKAYVARLRERPAYRRARESEAAATTAR